MFTSFGNMENYTLYNVSMSSVSSYDSTFGLKDDTDSRVTREAKRNENKKGRYFSVITIKYYQRDGSL